ncbi:PREDICTED: reticulon-4 receptor-like 2 [Myotis davidii]|uniref:reticulon-4 receptor-like 2 n=1 Tax=Myotis davidii TaxID=225400 RepID=UPI00076774DF|nr:PREDICTED: reticulon-4 receptor-like 2 [Myotis davidii]
MLMGCPPQQRAISSTFHPKVLRPDSQTHRSDNKNGKDHHSETACSIAVLSTVSSWHFFIYFYFFNIPGVSKSGSGWGLLQLGCLCPELSHPGARLLAIRGGWAGPWRALLPLQPAQKGLPPVPTGPASACLLLLLLALPPAAPSCPMLCTCYSSPPTVSCQANNFSSVPLSLPPSTQRLFLQNNLIRTLRPGTFGPNLLTLWLFSNNLSTIYPGTFRHLQALEELDLGDNRHLRSLEPDTFQGLERLQSLHLYRCQLSSLPANIFRGLVSLQYLYLQENSLLHLQDDLFADLANLSHLFLHGNRLRLLTEHVFRGLGGLDRLLLVPLPLYFGAICSTRQRSDKHGSRSLEMVEDALPC